ncbi:male abnormal protein mab-31-like [Palaemon carinicauda]|uniref:male abnormal protein mab-31-like n=1 Tax=Palaemon carinicauda TaxID=392227 RepID=UPI0035B644AA
MAAIEITCNGTVVEENPWTFIHEFWLNTPNALEYLRAHGVLPISVICKYCHLPCSLRQEANMFYCGRYVRVQKKKRKQCPYSVSLFKGTFLENARVPAWKIVLFANHFIQKSWDHSTVIRTLHFSTRTSVDWRSFCSEVTLNWLYTQEPIGGPDIIVEIDETFFVKRKYHRGRQLSQVWLFGGIERLSKKKFIIPLHKEGQDRSAETLIPLIRQYIKAGSVIMSDGWAAYKTLSNKGYIHKVINHSENFVDPNDPSIHTQTIERQWRNVKEWSKRPGMKADYFDQYFSRYLFFESYPINPVHQFFLEVGKLYRPHGNHPRPPVYESDDE